MGVGIGALWQGLLEGRSCLAPMSRFDASGFPCSLAGEARDFSAKDFVPKSYRKAVKVMARDIELAVGAAKCAVEDARIVTRGVLPEGAAGGDAPLTFPPERVGCQIGAGLIAADVDELSMALATARRADTGQFDIRAWGGPEGGGGGGMENLTPLWLLKYLPNMLACHVTIIHGAEGPSNTITCSEASGLLSIGESMRVIERDSADACFSGGAESKLNPMGFLRMDLAGWLAHCADQTDGSKVVRPFDTDAPSGTVLGEGGGILLLEELQSARARGATIYALCAGFGAAHADLPPVADDPGLGCRYAIENALEDAGIGPGDIDAIVPLASGVAATDRAEVHALRAVFGDRLSAIPLVTFAPNIGNCMAGQGGLQAAVAAMCIKEQALPARLYHGRAPEGLQVGAAPSRPARLDHVLVCSPALGGQNAALVLKRAG